MDLVTSSNCFCGNPIDPDHFSIQCDVCRQWFHGGCVHVKEYQSTDLDRFHCPNCVEKHGSSMMKIKTNFHRHDYSEIDADTKPVQTGTPVFIRELKSRHFPKADDIIKYLKGQQLTMQYLQTNGFGIPIVADNKDGLDMLVPPSNFSLHDIQNHIEGDREMDVIDVSRQSNIRMKLKEFVEYYNDPQRTRIFNLISLEFTNTGLSSLVEAPYIARKLDWVNYVWPRDWPEDSDLKKPEVQKYCLIGVKDSFTDFHIDFGGTSVWYHILQGEKIFYLIKPTPANLHLYQQWMCSSTQSETFFGDQVDACYKCVLKQGQTMLIPTGWIHAVLTPVDSLVFGGNFVHSLNIPMQIQIYEMERKMKTPAKFQYPGFETIHWFAAKRLLKELKDLNLEEKKCPTYFLQGIKALLSILKIWNTDKDYNMVSRGQIPNVINSQKLLKDLSKEIRHAERFLIALNPPKPERESKRKKKKPFNKDFIDFNVNDRMSDSSKVKSLVKEQTIKKEQVISNTDLLNVPPIKLTLPKSKIYPPSDTFVNNEKSSPESDKIIPIKKMKILSPQTHDVQKSNSTIIPCSNKTPNVKKTLNVKKTSTVIKKVLKTGKKNPKVIRFKLGDKEMVRSAKDKSNNIYGNFTLDHAVETRKELTWKQTTSVYDFHDGSNESDYSGFMIDEAPIRRKILKSTTNSLKKIVRPLDVDSEKLNATPKNGIEELLKASAYTLSASTSKLDAIPSVNIASFVQATPTSTGASPSTRDAIAGMLSFSGQCYPVSPGGPEASPTHTKSPKLNPVTQELENEDDDDLLVENIDKVHQDDVYIYPALDVSDDDEFMFKSKSKKEVDEAWNPKARVGPLLPKTNRPAREGVKKMFVEKGLEAAAKKRANQSGPSKRSHKKKRLEPMSILRIPETAARILPDLPMTQKPISEAIGLHGNLVEHVHTCSSILTSPNRLKDVKAKLAAPVPVERKPRKGMKTAKQRLGKILKIHKMLH